MKFLYFTDTHIRGINPRSRTDNFYETLKNKFEEIIQITEENKVDYILHGGDWFDRPDIAPSIVRDFAMMVKRFNRPIYTIAGNHDIYGHNPDTISRTMLGLLEGTGVVHILKDDQPVILEKEEIKVELYGHSYSYEIDSKESKKSYIIEKDPTCKYCINMIHGMLLPKPFIEGIKYTVLDEILSTEADITLAGHYHTGFGIKKINDKYFVNPGSLTRISALKSEIERVPQIVVIDLNGDIKIWTEKLKCALPGEKILDREHIESAQYRAYKLNQFFQNASAAGDFKQIKIDMNKIIDEIVSSEGLKEEVKLEAVRRIENARTSLAEEEE